MMFVFYKLFISIICVFQYNSSCSLLFHYEKRQFVLHLSDRGNTSDIQLRTDIAASDSLVFGLVRNKASSDGSIHHLQHHSGVALQIHL